MEGKKQIGQKAAWIVLALLMAAITVIGLNCRLMSIQDLCHRPQDVITTERVYDEATGTYIQYLPTWGRCEPLNYPGEVGTRYIRLQWWGPGY